MADGWEPAHGCNPAIDDSAGDIDGDGYTNIEEYLHYLAGIADTYLPPSVPTELRIVP